MGIPWNGMGQKNMSHEQAWVFTSVNFFWEKLEWKTFDLNALLSTCVCLIAKCWSREAVNTLVARKQLISL